MKNLMMGWIIAVFEISSVTISFFFKMWYMFQIDIIEIAKIRTRF